MVDSLEHSLDRLIEITAYFSGADNPSIWVGPIAVWQTAREKEKWKEISEIEIGYSGLKTNILVSTDFVEQTLKKCVGLLFCVEENHVKMIYRSIESRNPISASDVFEKYGLTALFETIEYGSYPLGSR